MHAEKVAHAKQNALRILDSLTPKCTPLLKKKGKRNRFKGILVHPGD